MQWISNKYTKWFLLQYSYLVPDDFDYKFYINNHADLQQAGVDSEEKAKEHYAIFGKKENRQYKYVKQKFHIDSNQHIPEVWNHGKNLLYFAPTAPDYDQSGGGKRLFQILSVLKKDLKYNIWFMCNGYSTNKKYVQELKNMGISVYMPNMKKQQYLNFYLEQAKKEGIIFHNAIFSWYDMGNQYIDAVRKIYPNIKIIVDSVDVHWIREQRGKGLKRIKIHQKVLDNNKQIEKNVYNKANVILAVTEEDKKHIQKELGYGTNIKILSSINEKKRISLGNNIFFIGNYHHTPNIEAVNNCIKIYKAFQKTKTFKELKYKPELNIVGSNLPESILTKIQKNQHIKYMGHVSNLDSVYSNSCLLLSPLTWGAGIKIKVCDAGMAGIPILTSDIGNEGIYFRDKQHALIANNDIDFVKQLEYFFSLSKKEKENLGKAAQDHLHNRVSKTSAKNILKHILQPKHIVISIVTYNQPKRLEKCLDVLLEKTEYPNYSIVITDNSTNKKTQKIIKKYKQYKHIQYIKNRTNKYFIEPNNKIMQDAKYSKSDIVLINDDIEILDKYWLNYLYSSVYSANYIAAAGGKTIYPNGTLAEAGAELYNDGHGKNKGRYNDPDDIKYNIPHYTGYCSGCLLYMRRDAINKIGVFSTKLEKMYYEDAEWQYRAHIYGLKTVYDHRCIAIHDEGSSAGTDITKGSKKYQEINRHNFLAIMNKFGNPIETYNNER